MQKGTTKQKQKAKQLAALNEVIKKKKMKKRVISGKINTTSVTKCNVPPTTVISGQINTT